MKEEFLTTAFTRARNTLRGIARRFGQTDESDADDMLQDAFLRLWGSHFDPASVEEAEALSRTVVRNIAIDRYRRQTGHRSVPIDEVPSLQETPDRDPGEDITEVYQSVKTLIDGNLSQRDREIVYLRDRDGWEFEEIAARYHVSEANVRVILSRARRTIRQLYLQSSKQSAT